MRPNKIKCDGCGREVLLENAEGWTTVTVGVIEALPVGLMAEAGTDTGEACSRKCHLDVDKKLYDALVKRRKDQAEAAAAAAAAIAEAQVALVVPTSEATSLERDGDLVARDVR